jgi:hypothetical protein
MPSGFSGETTLFGIRVAFESDSREALQSALSIFPNCALHGSRSPELSIYVVLATDKAQRPAIELHQIRARKLHIIRNEIELRADGEEGRGICFLPSDATDSELFREAINTVVLFLVAQRGRVPVHASAVVIHGRAFVMAGRSGTGKSALALAANHAGLPVLAEDTVFVQHEPFCVWGAPKDIHVSEKDAPRDVSFRTRFRSGRLKRAISIANARHRADEAAFCVLARGETVALDALSPDDAVRALTREPEPGYEFYGSRMEAAIRDIACGGCWQLTLSHDPDAAIAALLDAFDCPDAHQQFG